MIYSEENSTGFKCSNEKCDNYININYSKFKGGENDSERITYECNKCQTQGISIIKNSETLTISGAKVIDTEYLN
jgi:hypothetical protein